MLGHLSGGDSTIRAENFEGRTQESCCEFTPGNHHGTGRECDWVTHVAQAEPVMFIVLRPASFGVTPSGFVHAAARDQTPSRFKDIQHE